MARGQSTENSPCAEKGTIIPLKSADIVDVKVGDKLFFTIDDEKVRIPTNIIEFDGEPELEGEICVDIDADSMVMLEVTKKRVMLKDLV